MTQVQPDIAYIPCTPEIVSAMLILAEVNSHDILYDLGCGDGRILTTAAQQFCTQGVGIDIDPQRILEANLKAKETDVTNLVKFSQGNLFESDFADATVVFLYLLPHLNLRLRPRLLNQLKAGTRIVSRDFDMGDWLPEKSVVVEEGEEEATLHYWEIP
ncbi:MAG: class I SAM-dependent methyltransferase [Chroococcales cyanobacterium]